MKILCISDEIDPLIYSSGLRQRYHDVDLVLSAGDLPQDYLEFVSSMLNKPMFFVEGNHDGRTAGRIRDEFGFVNPYYGRNGAMNLGFRIVRHDGLILLGIPGSIRYNGGGNQYSESSIALHILALLPRMLWNRLVHGRSADIILTHAPPRGIHDREDRPHRGFTSFLWLIRFVRPRYFIHGHIHLYDLAETRTTRSGTTTIVNAYSHWVIDTGDGQA